MLSCRRAATQVDVQRPLLHRRKMRGVKSGGKDKGEGSAEKSIRMSTKKKVGEVEATERGNGKLKRDWALIIMTVTTGKTKINK